MGHIELASPVSHIWYYRSVPSRMGLLLDLTVASLRSILYYEKYIVIDSGDTELNKYDLLSEEEYNEAVERYGMSFTPESERKLSGQSSKHWILMVCPQNSVLR